MSLLWPLPVTAEQAVSLPLLTALAVRLALQPYAEQTIVVKWPNDLLVMQGDELQKLAGILVELTGEKLIIGVGVNVWDQADSSSKLLEGLSRGLIHRMLEYLERYFELGSTFAMFADEYRQHMARIGDYVELRNATGQLLAAGTLEGINDAGHVIIASDTTRQAIPSGDVTFRAN
jgi:BirA family biotin operon repressor/biotin-[acetyl-CoA-carboxylase] ligase